MLAPAAALAQAVPDAQKTTAPTDAVGPSELQNFSLSGTVTKPADQQPAAPATQAPAPTTASSETAQAAPKPERRADTSRQTTRVAAATAAPIKPVAKAPAPTSLPTSPLEAMSSPALPPTSQPTFSTASLPAAPTPGLAPEHSFSILPWVLAALVAAGAALFLLWRRRQHEALAGVPRFDMFVPPEPVPAPAPRPRPAPPVAAPQPAPAPPKPAAPATTGIVSSRLRPALEISVQPLRCLLEDDRLVLEFELELFNAGAAPARAVMAEASLFNAGAAQEQELAGFFSKPVGAGEPVDAIPPMKRMSFVSQVVAPRSAIQEFELGGRKVAVPILAFNALYQWSSGNAQSSAAYLVGRDTNGDKLGPFGLDRTPREFRKLGAHALPTALRT